MRRSILFLIILLVPAAAAQVPVQYEAALQSDEDGFPDGSAGAETDMPAPCDGPYPWTSANGSASAFGQQANASGATVMVLCWTGGDLGFDLGTPDPGQGVQWDLFVAICGMPGASECIAPLEMVPGTP